jgi:hypothetical protein
MRMQSNRVSLLAVATAVVFTQGKSVLGLQ